jgi:hypothetical protein
MLNIVNAVIARLKPFSPSEMWVYFFCLLGVMAGAMLSVLWVGALSGPCDIKADLVPLCRLISDTVIPDFVRYDIWPAGIVWEWYFSAGHTLFLLTSASGFAGLLYLSWKRFQPGQSITIGRIIACALLSISLVLIAPIAAWVIAAALKYALVPIFVVVSVPILFWMTWSGLRLAGSVRLATK